MDLICKKLQNVYSKICGLSVSGCTSNLPATLHLKERRDSCDEGKMKETERPSQPSSLNPQTANCQLYQGNPTSSQTRLEQTDPDPLPRAQPSIQTLTHIGDLVLGQGRDHQTIRHWAEETMSRKKTGQEVKL